MNTLVTCKKCGWIHVLLTRAQAQEDVESFNRYFDSLPQKTTLEYYGGRRATMEPYEKCFSCGSPETMRWFEEGDCPEGVTLQATILGPKEHHEQ